MAKIPTGSYGYRTPQGNDVTPMAQVDTQVSQATQRLGNTALGISEQISHDAKVEADRAAQVQTLTAHANIQNGLADSYDAITRDLQDGKTDKIGATAAWKDAREKVVADNLKAVPADRQPLVAAQVQGLEGQLTNRLFDNFRKRDQQDVAGGLVTYGEQMQRFAATDFNAAVKQHSTYVDQMGPAAGWSPEQIVKAKQTFVEGVTFNKFRAEGQAAMQSGNPDAIDAVQQRLGTAEGDALDPGKRNMLDQTLFGWKQSILAKQARQADAADREQLKRENAAVTIYNQAGELQDGGAFYSPEFIAQGIEATRGTAQEKPFLDLVASQKEVSGFAGTSAATRAQQLTELRMRRSNPAVGSDPMDEKRLNKAEQIDAGLRKKVDDGEAWNAALSVGVINSLPTLDMSNPQSAMAAFQQRSKDIGAVEAWAGKKISPLQPAEAEAFTKVLRTLKPDQAASMLSQIGNTIGDADRIAALGKQIGDKDGTMGMAMLYAGSKTSQGRYTAEAILLGQQALKDKSVKVDGMAESGWRSTASKMIRGAFSNAEVEDKMIDASFLIMAGRAGDSSFSDRNIEAAVALATGGIIERNGGKIPLPYGMKENDFEKRIESITPANLADQTPGGVVIVGPNRVPVAEFVKTIPDARLVHAGQGIYNVRAGNTLVTNERGQRITLKVSP